MNGDPADKNGAQYLRRLSHDIRGPLGVTLGALDELELALGADAATYASLLAMARRGARKVLQIAESMSQRSEELNRDEAAPSNGTGTAKANVLIVDDDNDTGELLALTLERAGFTPILATSLSEGKRLLEAGSAEALVSDLVLPDGSGLELASSPGAQRLRARIILSGHGAEQRDESLSRGFHEHFVKPIDGSVLVNALKKHLTAS
jgi:CheY-like chemotaxis protein